MEKRNYFQDVWDVARLIPKGRVTSYGAIAKYIGMKSSRMVGWAMAAASSQNDIPAWRVVNRNGELTGSPHFETPTKMQELLENEGIVVKNGKISDFKKIYWDPSIEL
ncbi:MAG: cysteine methyltransferase [Pseudopedobacter saltans]|uniref:Cysteine methyltransferase n=1 Tax=Pseudopedobacter saltans TaxID=151895 RepID=A0A2W5GKX8_9SPHI|nr:MAG: cysteine methyltransferase [Pseudopedobacter saltans]